MTLPLSTLLTVAVARQTGVRQTTSARRIACRSAVTVTYSMLNFHY
jgi:hypothetical protein